MPRGRPCCSSRNQEGINVLLCDQVRPALPFAECTKAVLHNGSAHLVWVHLQHLCNFIYGVVFHLRRFMRFHATCTISSPSTSHIESPKLFRFGEEMTNYIQSQTIVSQILKGGAGGSRTPVQTSNACSVLHAQSTIDFRPGADRGRPTPDLALSIFATGSRRPLR